MPSSAVKQVCPQSLLLKEAIIDNVFDEDLYQELCVTLLDCIRKFRI